MQFQKSLNELKKKQLERIYLLLGKEQYLSDIFKHELEKKVLNELDDEMNYAEYDMKEDSLRDVLAELEILPFFGDCRLVIMQNPFFLTRETKKAIPQEDLDAFTNYINSPSPTSVLLIIAPYDKLDSRKKIVKLLKSKVTIIDVSVLGENSLKDFLKTEISNNLFDISGDDLDYFIRMTDGNLTSAMNELKKLFLFNQTTKLITKESITALIPKSLENNVFDLSEYVSQKNTSNALQLFYDLVQQGEEPIKITALLESHFRLLLQIRFSLDHAIAPNNIASYLKIHPYRVKLAMKTVKQQSVILLSQRYNELVELDYKMKTGQGDRITLLELFLLRATT